MLKLSEIQKNSIAGSVVMFTASFMTGFLLADTKIGGVASFADISAAGALGLPSATAILTGSIIHSIFMRSVGKNIIKISSLILIMIIKLFSETKKDPRLCGFTTAMSIIASGAAVSAIIGEVFYKLIFYIIYGIIAGIGAFSLSTVIQGLNNRFVADFTSVKGYSYAVVYTLSIAALCTIELPLINLGAITGIFITLIASYRYGCSGGALCGSLAVCGAFLASEEIGMAVVLLPVSGIITGYADNRKHTTSAMIFLAVSFMLTVLSGASSDSVDTMLNLLLGALLFSASAPYFSDRLIKTETDVNSGTLALMDKRMKFLSDSVRDVRRQYAKLSDILSSDSDVNNNINGICKEVCTGCHRRLACWKNESGKTSDGFRKVSVMSEISEEKFPYELEECLHKPEIIRLLEKTSHENAVTRLIEMRFSESRKLLLELIKIIEEVIGKAGHQPELRFSDETARKVRNKLEKFNINPNSVTACYNSSERLLIELYFSGSEHSEEVIRICDLVSDELHIPLAASEPVNSGEEVRIRLFEHPKYALEVYGVSMSAENNGQNGDTSHVFGDGTGISYIVLSDGMGSGKAAALESGMVVKLFRRLINSGIDYKSAVKLINSVMFAKSGNEAFATLDAARIDLDTGELTIIKSGASATLIRHDGGIMKVSSSSFPIGIYERSEIFTGSYAFEEGDIIIMLSDGISENEYKFIRELLLQGDDLKLIVDEIYAKSTVFKHDSHDDDVTVIGIKLNTIN